MEKKKEEMLSEGRRGEKESDAAHSLPDGLPGMKGDEMNGDWLTLPHTKAELLCVFWYI